MKQLSGFYLTELFIEVKTDFFLLKFYSSLVILLVLNNEGKLYI
jgi:hypothetical protein